MSMNPKYFDFTKHKWHWYHLPPKIREKLEKYASADELICVKAADKRVVYRFDNLFIKVSGSYRLKSQIYPAAKQEFNSYCQLKKYNIGAVKHLGWGRFGHYTALVTEAWSSDTVNALNYYYKLIYELKDPSDFLKCLADYLREILNTPLHHGDFHLGHLLYSPSRRDFTLVDLRKVYVGKKLTAGEKSAMLQILVELRSGVRPQTMLDLFWQAGSVDEHTAAKEIHKKLCSDLQRTLKDWPRRLKQFLHGYSKFSDFVEHEGAVLLVQRDKLRRNLFDPAAAQRGTYQSVRLAFPAALEVMLFSFYLSLLHIPHIPVAALSPNGTLYYPQLPECFKVPEDRDWVNSFNEYLLCLGLHLEDYQQWRGTDSQLLIADFSSMLTSMPDRSMFKPDNVDPRRWRLRKR